MFASIYKVVRFFIFFSCFGCITIDFTQILLSPSSLFWLAPLFRLTFFFSPIIFCTYIDPFSSVRRTNYMQFEFLLAMLM